MPDTVIKNKLVVKDLGNPSLVKLMEGEKAKHVLGTIMGIATSVGRKADKTDPTKIHTFLKGTFEGMPSDPKADIVSSGVCYLPEGIQAMIESKLEGEHAADSVQFALEVATVKATNAAGYTWAVTPMVAASEADPLQALRQQAADFKQKSLPAPEKTKSK